MAVLSSLTPASINRVFYDDRIEDIPFDDETDLVAINIETYTAARGYQIASKYRKRNIKVVLGGFHATLMPDEASLHADAVLIGEAEGVWSQLLEDLKKNKLKKTYEREKGSAIEYVIPDRSIFHGKKYPKISLVETGRGCMFGCEFCSVTHFFKKSYHPRPLDIIVKEIKQLHNKIVFFVDDNIGSDRKRARELFNALIPLKIYWISQVSMDICNDEELLKLMKKSGCQGVLIGFESLDSDVLTRMGKGVNRAIKSYDYVVKKLHSYNIEIYATFVMGYGETKKVFQDTLRFGVRNKLLYLAFNHLVPFPGTPIYAKLESERRLLYKKWWLEPGYRFGDVAFHPTNMSSSELTNLCLSYRYKFFNLRSILRRLLNRVHWANHIKIQAYAILNFMANHETTTRRSLLIGGAPNLIKKNHE